MFKINARPYECQNRCQIDWQFECQGLCLKECQLSLGTHGREAHCELYISRGTHGPEHMSERMSELVPDKMSEYMPEIARVYIFAIYISR